MCLLPEPGLMEKTSTKLTLSGKPQVSLTLYADVSCFLSYPSQGLTPPNPRFIINK
jgi:hypothetical protein